MPLRVVLDTNILLSALAFPKGRRARIWEIAQQGRYQALTSPAIISELARILRTSFDWEEQRVQRAIRAVVHTADVIALTSSVNVVRDPKDNHIIVCAIDGNAGAIVSGDNDLLALKDYQNIPVLHPADFLCMFGE